MIVFKIYGQRNVFIIHLYPLNKYLRTYYVPGTFTPLGCICVSLFSTYTFITLCFVLVYNVNLSSDLWTYFIQNPYLI